MLDELSTPPTAVPLRERVADIVAAVRARPGRTAAVALLLAVIAAALWWLLRPPPPIAPEALLPVATTAPASAPPAAGAPSSDRSPGEQPTPSTLVVHVAGAVARPGVLRLPVGARVVDAIDAAGGAAPDADVERVNLAAPLSDGSWIHVPRAGEPAATPPAGGAGSGSTATGSTAGATSDGPIDLNAATAEQLDSLPGVGPATAAAIIEHRTRNGPFTQVDALADVTGIGPAKLERLRPLVRV